MLFGPNGIAEKAKKGSMIIDTSTIYVSDAIAFQTRLRAFELSYSDCPISGLPFRAADGSLTMMFGGTLSEFQQARPYLDIMGRSILYCGDCGNGQLIKAFNNVVYDINLAAISEILPLAMKSGLDLERFEAIIHHRF